MYLDLDIMEETKKDGQTRLRIWEPKGPCIVLGRSNIAKKELYFKQCVKDGVSVQRRAGGGGTVYIDKGVVIITITKTVDNHYENEKYFKKINDIICNSLEKIGVKNLCQNGISDICINDRKLMGSSMYRSESMIFYQGSLLVDTDISKIEKYIRHPSKAPDYRNKRAHKDFLITLRNAGYDLPIDKLIEHLRSNINDNIRSVN